MGWKAPMACRADHPLDMGEELETMKALPGFWEVVRDIDLGLRPNTLIALMENGEWWELEFEDAAQGLRNVTIRTIEKPDALVRRASSEGKGA